MIVYGINSSKSKSYYDENILRVPPNLIKSCNLPNIVEPMLESSPGVDLPFYTSIYSTSHFLKEKFINHMNKTLESSNTNLEYLLLSRAIVSDKTLSKNQKPAESKSSESSEAVDKNNEDPSGSSSNHKK